MRGRTGLLVLVTLLLGVLQVPGAAPARAACDRPPLPGVPLPATAPRDPLVDRLGLDRAWQLTRGAGVTVAVVDTGVDPASPKLAGAVQTGTALSPVPTPEVYAITPGGQEDCDGHGTQVAAIVAGRTAAGDDRVSGVAPDAAVYPVSITGEIGNAPSALVGAAIRDAADHASVVNLSFARPVDDPDVRAAVEYALARDVVVVAAAGNEDAAQDAGRTWYPAAYPGVLAVAAVGADGLSLTTTRGDWISVGAPGASLTTVDRGGVGFVAVTGTSFAAAVVSGQAALIRSLDPALPAAEVVRRVQQTAVAPGDADPSGRDTSVGHGVVDPFASLSAVLPAGPAAAAGPVVVGRVAVPDVDAADPAAARARAALGWASLLALAAVVALVAGVALRAGRRRGWRPGPAPATPRGARHAVVPVTADGLGSDSDAVMVGANRAQLVEAPERS
ncbi:S8 family serine peptidase [Goekera deserti]|uniref:S8 family serine peptidase n=1 Tax=Goekera deserti TaxID=2497753 RepID=A0A7K3WCN2_9ACTN|nr:S8 family serine peptidase [Goekera deserti]NDI46659.1 S8 family serine peptidase [Goekera deserti]NEL54228.1 S8 family serine peptidase [Goekera deserti]